MKRNLLTQTSPLRWIAACAILTMVGQEPSFAAPAKPAASSPQKNVSAPATVKPTAKPAPATAAKPAAKPVAKPAPAAAAKPAVASIPLPRSRPADKAAVAPTTAPAVTSVPSQPAPAHSIAAGDLAAVKQALELIRRGKTTDAYALTRGVQDRAAAKLIEWVILRSDYTDGVPFERYVAFVTENPTWPSLTVFRRRAEASLWHDRREPSVVRAFFAHQKPISAKGRLALARALAAQGDRKAAEPHVRETWRNESFSQEVETATFNSFGDLLTRADHKARMDMLLYGDDNEAAMRMAQRLGGTEIAIAKARIAMNKKAADAKALLDAVPAEARRDPGYMFSRIQLLRRTDKIAEAGELMLAVPNDPAVLGDLDEWWNERRVLSRALLDLGDAKSAYLVARNTPPPPKENYRVEHHFMSGWLALRFLNDPATALSHFARIPEGISNPHALARGDYWQGRALEALGRNEEARRHYEAAALHSTVHYGQIARARLGLPDLPVRPPPQPRPGPPPDIVRAAEMLYVLNERDLANIVMADLGERGNDLDILAGVGATAARYNDARGMLLLGKGAIGRGFAFDFYAHPTVGLPNYTPIGPAVDPVVSYSIARTESHFSQKVFSTAKAMGLMQVTPAAGRDTAKVFKVAYDEKRLMTDPVYNMQLGAGELAILLQGYRGSYILTFAGYNAGRGRVKEWIARYGDPRDPKVDPIDWIERIPIAETRNYVPRILEALQVYRILFGGSSKLLIEADLRRGSTSTN